VAAAKPARAAVVGAVRGLEGSQRVRCPVAAAIWTVAALTAASGIVVAVRMYETLPAHRPAIRRSQHRSRAVAL